MSLILTADPELRDLARDRPALVDATTGARTGFVLERTLGVGGMATVFLARRAEPAMPVCLSPLTPDRIACKVIHLPRPQFDPFDFFGKEHAAYRLLSSMRPPSPYCVQAYGAGTLAIHEAGRTRRAPWLALELVEGGNDGLLLDERIVRAPEGIDPPRALRLVRGLLEGLRVLHLNGVVHRDVKPENVLVAGPVDAEVPKLADYGIARVGSGKTGLGSGTIPYAAREQMFATPDASNPFIGQWTDVHALAQVVWSIVGGEPWLSIDDWHANARRSLRSARRVHAGFLAAGEPFDALDRALARASSPRLPELVGARPIERAFESVRAAIVRGVPADAPPRFADLASFAAALVPPMESIARAWIDASARARRPVTVFRVTEIATSKRAPAARHSPGRAKEPLRCASVRADGSVLACAGRALTFLVGDRAEELDLPEPAREIVERTHAIVDAGPLGDVCLAPHALLFVRADARQIVALPEGARAARAAFFAHDRLHLVAEGHDVDDGALVFSTDDGARWSEPVVVPINGGVVRAAAYGPHGALLVGDRDDRARASFLRPDGATQSFARGLGAVGALLAAACGAEASWGASSTQLVRFDRAGVTIERVGEPEPPVDLALDLGGHPWLVTAHAVFRREIEGSRAVWSELLRRPSDAPPFVAIGFTRHEARVIDALAGAVTLADPS